MYEFFANFVIVRNKNSQKLLSKIPDSHKAKAGPHARPGLRFRLLRYSSNEWITTPERSLGSNHVVFGGMMLPVSAMLISCCIDTG